MSQFVISRKIRRGILAAILVVLVALVTVVATRPASAESELPTRPLILFDGTETTLASFEGKPIVINFWASWCPACVAELPDLEEVHQEFGDEVTILGIANADRRVLADALAEEVGLTYTLADDPDGDFFREFGLFAMPTTLFITSDGQIHEVFGGQLNKQGIVDRVTELIAAS